MALREFGDGLRRVLQKAAGVQGVALRQQGAQSCHDQGLRSTEAEEPALTLVGVQFERPIQVTAELVPQRWIKRCRAHTEWQCKCAPTTLARVYSSRCVSGIACQLR